MTAETTTTGPQAALYAALAKFQAELPAISTNHTVKTEKYTYEYADLAAVSAVVLPLLAKHGLAFTSRPTVIEGKFVLAYKLTHEAGGSESGEYPLTSGAPQSVGSAITYARRYALYAVTGVFPSGEDDDGQRAETGYRHQRGEAPRGNEQANGRVTRPQSPREQAAQAKAAGTPADAAADDSDWGAAIAGAATGEECDRVEAEMKAAFDGGRLVPVKAQALRKMLNVKRDKLATAGATS